MISSTSSGAAGALWGQLQQQMAQRTADQAEQRAQALQASAQSAQAAADRAQANARSLKVESSQAQSEAQNARRNLAAQASFSELTGEFTALREQIATVTGTASAPITAAPALSTTTFTNSEGQTTGALINVTA